MKAFLAFLGLAAYYKHDASLGARANTQLQADHAKIDALVAEVDATLAESRRQLQQDAAEHEALARLDAWQAETAARRAATPSR